MAVPTLHHPLWARTRQFGLIGRYIRVRLEDTLPACMSLPLWQQSEETRKEDIQNQTSGHTHPRQGKTYEVSQRAEGVLAGDARHCRAIDMVRQQVAGQDMWRISTTR